MKLLFDFFPVIVFFVAYKVWGIFAATAAAIAASIVQVGYHRWQRGRFEPLHLATLGLIVIFGGATLLLNDKHYIMWKPTVVHWAIAMAFLISHYVGDKPLIERLLGGVVQLPARVWYRLSFSWIAFYVGLGLANWFVAERFFEVDAALQAVTGAPLGEIANATACGQHFDGIGLALCRQAVAREEGWVSFKLFGTLGLTLVFVVLQGFYIARHTGDAQASATEQQSETR